MRIDSVDIPIRTRLQAIDVKILADIHGGHANCREDKLAQVIKEIKDNPDARWIGMGDDCEYINPGDKRFDSTQVAEWALTHPRGILGAQKEWFKDTFTPIKDKCLAKLRGNHEGSIIKYLSDDFHDKLCEDLGLPNFDICGMLRTRFVRGGIHGASYRLVWFLHHGYGGGRLWGGKALKIQRLPIWYDANVYILGHDHGTGGFKEQRLSISNKGRLLYKPHIGFHAGTFLEGYVEDNTSYAEERLLPPNYVGAPTIRIVPHAPNPIVNLII